MNEIPIDVLRKIEIELLSYLKKICDNNNIKYFLYAGTLAGAINYNNYLPNDDDIDIVLPRPDYQKLINILEKEKIYKILTPYNTKDYYYPFAKLVKKETKLIETNCQVISELGVYIDIFPIDGLPNYFKKIYLYKMRLLKRLILTNMIQKPKITKLHHLLYYFNYYIIKFVDYLFKNKDKNFYALLIDKKAQKYKFDHSKYVSLVTFGDKNSNYLLKEVFCNQKMYYFCNDYYSSFVNGKEVLKKIYGLKKIKNNKNKKHKNKVYFR